LDRYNKTKELKARITQNVFWAPYDENTRVIMQYDEHLRKPTIQWHVKEIFGRGFKKNVIDLLGVTTFGNFTPIVEVSLLAIPSS
jgi:hypothetical protein